MNILILNWRDPKHPLAGGAENYVLKLAKYWIRKGANITWFASEFKGSLKEEVIEGINVIRKGSHFSVHINAYIDYKKGLLSSPDIVIDCFHFIPFFTPLYIKRTKIIPLIHEVAQELWFTNLPWFFAIVGYFMEPFFIKMYKKFKFITVSPSTKNELITIGIKKGNIFTIFNGINRFKTHSSKKKEKVPMIIFLGTIAKDKGIIDAIKAFKEINKKIPKAKFIIVGKEEIPGSIKSYLKEYTSNEIVKNIKYVGYVSEEKKHYILQKAWIILVPSVKEGWGNIILEAGLHKTPAVAYNVLGLKDSIQNNKTGILVEKEPKTLAQASINLLLDNKKRDELGENAYRFTKKFNWLKSMKESWNLINK